jgi:hypothetical protein
MSSYATVMQVVEQRTNSLVQKSAGRLSESEALRQVFKADPALYAHYRHASSHQPAPDRVHPREVAAPTGVEALIAARTEALIAKGGLSVVEATRVVLNADPELYARYRQGDQPASHMAKPSASTTAAPPGLSESARTLAKMLAPQDPEGEGRRKVDLCLQELVATIKRRPSR